MRRLICWFCGSDKIVWDHANGLVVCSTCGAVLEGMIEDHMDSYVIMRPRGRERRPEVPKAPPDLLNRKAMATLRSEEEIRNIYYMLNKNPVLKARTLRVKVAVAVYAHRRASGYSKNRARREASAAAGVSAKSIVKLERNHRPLVEALVERVRALMLQR